MPQKTIIKGKNNGHPVPSRKPGSEKKPSDKGRIIYLEGSESDDNQTKPSDKGRIIDLEGSESDDNQTKPSDKGCIIDQQGEKSKDDEKKYRFVYSWEDPKNKDIANLKPTPYSELTQMDGMCVAFDVLGDGSCFYQAFINSMLDEERNLKKDFMHYRVMINESRRGAGLPIIEENEFKKFNTVHELKRHVWRSLMDEERTAASNINSLSQVGTYMQNPDLKEDDNTIHTLLMNSVRTMTSYDFLDARDSFIANGILDRLNDARDDFRTQVKRKEKETFRSFLRSALHCDEQAIISGKRTSRETLDSSNKSKKTRSTVPLYTTNGIRDETKRYRLILFNLAARIYNENLKKPELFMQLYRKTSADTQNNDEMEQCFNIHCIIHDFSKIRAVQVIMMSSVFGQHNKHADTNMIRLVAWSVGVAPIIYHDDRRNRKNDQNMNSSIRFHAVDDTKRKKTEPFTVQMAKRQCGSIHNKDIPTVALVYTGNSDQGHYMMLRRQKNHDIWKSHPIPFNEFIVYHTRIRDPEMDIPSLDARISLEEEKQMLMNVKEGWSNLEPRTLGKSEIEWLPYKRVEEQKKLPKEFRYSKNVGSLLVNELGDSDEDKLIDICFRLDFAVSYRRLKNINITESTCMDEVRKGNKNPYGNAPHSGIQIAVHISDLKLLANSTEWISTDAVLAWSLLWALQRNFSIIIPKKVSTYGKKRHVALLGQCIIAHNGDAKPEDEKLIVDTEELNSAFKFMDVPAVIPFCLNVESSHWLALCIRPKFQGAGEPEYNNNEDIIEWYDPTHSNTYEYVVKQIKKKLDNVDVFRGKDWKLVAVHKGLPTDQAQADSWNCAVFSMDAMACMSLRQKPGLKQRDAPIFREMVIGDIIKGEIRGPFAT